MYRLLPTMLGFDAVSVVAALLCATILYWYLWRDKEWQLVALDELPGYLRAAGAVSVIFGGANLATHLLGVPAQPAYAAIFFAAFAIPQAILCGLGIPPLSRGIILLAFTLALSSLVHGENAVVLCFAGQAGLMSAKLCELALSTWPAALDDVILPALWLSRNAGWDVLTGGRMPPLNDSFVLAAISLALLLRWVQPPFLKVDHLFVKRIALAATGAVSLFAVSAKVFFQTQFGGMSALYGFGFLTAYTLEGVDETTRRQDELVRAFKRTLVFLFVSLVMFLAGENYLGCASSLLLACTMIVAETSYAARMLALFWIAQTLFLEFVKDIHLAHSVSAFSIEVVASVLLSALFCIIFSIAAGGNKSTFRSLSAFVLAYCAAIVFALARESSLVALIGVLPALALLFSIWHQVFFEKRAIGYGQALMFTIILLAFANLSRLALPP